MDTLVSIALAQSLSRLVPNPYLEQRAARATGQGLKEFRPSARRAAAAGWRNGFEIRVSVQ